MHFIYLGGTLTTHIALKRIYFVFTPLPFGSHLYTRPLFLSFLTTKNGKLFLINDSNTARRKFGEIHKPRTRIEKKEHLEIFGNVFFDMRDAIKEKEQLDKEEYKHVDKNISEIIFKTNISKKNEVIKNFMRYCIELKNKENIKQEMKRIDGDTLTKKTNKEIDKQQKDYMLLCIRNNVRELSNVWNSCEIGIILNCFLKIKIKEPNYYIILLNEYFKRNQKFSEYGSIYVLKVFSKIAILPQHTNNLKILISDIIKKLDRYQFHNICVISNYMSSLYYFDKILIKDSIQNICSFVLKYKQNENEIENEIENDIQNEKCWTVDNTHFLVNACARVGYLKKSFFDFVAEKIKKNIEEFSIDQIISLINAYSKFKNAENSNFLNLFLLLSDIIIKKSYLLKPRHLSVLANALNNACIRHEHIFHIITETSIANLNSFEPKQLVMLVHSYVNLGMGNNELLPFIWKAFPSFLDTLSLQELGMILQAYTKGYHEKLDLIPQIENRIFHLLQTFYPFLSKEINSYNKKHYEDIWIHLKGNSYSQNSSSELKEKDEFDKMFYFLLYKNKYLAQFKKPQNLKEESTQETITCSDSNNNNNHNHNNDHNNNNNNNSGNIEHITTKISLSKQKSLYLENNKLEKEKTYDEVYIQKCGTEENTENIMITEYVKMCECRIIHHMERNINPTLICSILYSLVKGGCHVHYDLLIMLLKVSFLFIKHFKTSELANVCTALSEIYIYASETCEGQKNIIAKYQREEMTDLTYSIEEKQEMINSLKEITYDEYLYNSSKQYLILCEMFFDETNNYLLKTQTYKDIYSIYKLITSFGSLRLSKYAQTCLHIFKTNLLDVKTLSYLPLQKMANAFMQMNVYDEDVYAFINKIQKIKKQK